MATGVGWSAIFTEASHRFIKLSLFLDYFRYHKNITAQRRMIINSLLNILPLNKTKIKYSKELLGLVILQFFKELKRNINYEKN